MEFNKRCISKEEFKKHKDSDVTYALYVRDNLKPNDYFRTFDGQIFKSINVSPIEGNEIYYANGDYTWANVLSVVNFSDSLIDLIELGDYVNGKRVYNISIVDGLKYLDVEVEDYLSDMSFINADQITSIVTKEQFDSMKYEVE